MDFAFIDAEDERQILRLYALYCHYLNHGEVEGWAALFSPEGCFTRLHTGAGARKFRQPGGHDRRNRSVAANGRRPT